MSTTKTSTSLEFVDDLASFLEDYCSDELGALAQKYPSDKRSITIDYDDLYQWNPDVAEDYRDHPQQIRSAFEQALQQVPIPVSKDFDEATVRLTNLPDSKPVREIGRQHQIGRLVSVDAQVLKTSAVRPRLVKGVFRCQRCESLTEVPQTGRHLQEPHECRNCGRQGPFRLSEKHSEFIDHQAARIQEPPEQAQGTGARSMDVTLTDEIVQEFQAGDRVTLTAEQELVDGGDDAVFDVQLQARSITQEETSFEEIDVEEHRETIIEIANGEHGDPYELLVDSVNPQHHGDEEIKLAIALQLFGGWRREHPDGSSERGDPHILLMGDPGCGKSTFLDWTNSVAPRSTYASGKGATASGLTAAAVRDDFGPTEWSLEAGALVLANGGIAAIDEIDKVPDSAISSLHKALESQTIEVNKGGINATLNAQTALLAAGNPVYGRFDEYEPLAEQIDLSPTLLSRFDLLFLVSDEPDPDRDTSVVKHMQRARRAAGKRARGDNLSDDERAAVEPAIPSEILRAYIALAKQEVQPVLPEGEAAERLREWIVSLREVAAEKHEVPIPVTYRAEESIERLAEASARVRLSETVTLDDVQRAISLVETSMRQVGYDAEEGQFDADIIETGQSSSQRQRRKTLEQAIRDQNGLSEDELSTIAKDVDKLDPSRIEDDIQALLEKGIIYDAGGIYRHS